MFWYSQGDLGRGVWYFGIAKVFGGRWRWCFGTAMVLPVGGGSVLA